jgi:hypothetical protein
MPFDQSVVVLPSRTRSAISSSWTCEALATQLVRAILVRAFLWSSTESLDGRSDVAERLEQAARRRMRASPVEALLDDIVVSVVV